MRTKRDEFSEEIKAQAFARDLALCCYSGKSLWCLDYGAGPDSIDWTDHIKPAARGGDASLENAACASWLYNKVKGASLPGVRLFDAGRPNADFFTLYETIPLETADHIKRFRAIHWTDWYFNRAVYQTKLAAAQEDEPVRKDGKVWTRGLEYTCKAAFNFLKKWRILVEREQPSELERRGLVPAEPSADQRLLLRLLDAVDAADVQKVVLAVAPYSAASWQAFLDLSEVDTETAARRLLKRVRADKFVTDRVKRAVTVNVERLWTQVPN